jgi:hypothetical protein
MDTLNSRPVAIAQTEDETRRIQRQAASPELVRLRAVTLLNAAERSCPLHGTARKGYSTTAIY